MPKKRGRSRITVQETDSSPVPKAQQKAVVPAVAEKKRSAVAEKKSQQPPSEGQRKRNLELQRKAEWEASKNQKGKKKAPKKKKQKNAVEDSWLEAAVQSTVFPEDMAEYQREFLGMKEAAFPTAIYLPEPPKRRKMQPK
jgi:hypothetical protein